jgi:hypothetical protein
MKAPKLNFIAVVIPMLVIFSCDIVNDDVKPKEISATLYASSGKPALLNLSAVTNGEKLFATGTASSSSGKFESILGGKYILYTPNVNFSEDETTLNLSDSKNKVVSQLKLQAKSLESAGCAVTGVYDYARIAQGKQIVIDLLDNDVFCGVGYNGGIIGHVAYEGPESEDFLLSLGPGREAKFIYTPTPGFAGKIKVIYNLGINWIAPHNSTEEVLANPKKYLEAFTTAMVEIEVE